MRTEDGNNNTMASTLSKDTQNTFLSTSSNIVNQESNKECTIAVTTSPRKDCTLAYCLASIEACGWNPIVFAEPGSTETDYQTIQNETRLGVWHNWLHAARWSLENTSTEYIMTVQDDVVFHPESKKFLDFIQWPKNAAFVSLYTPRHYSRKRPVGVNAVGTKSLWGACALTWNRRVLEVVIDTPIAKNWLGAPTRTKNPMVFEMRKQNPQTIANSDTAIGKIVRKLDLKMYFIDPSPCHHIAQYSTIAHGGNQGNRNCGRCANFETSLFSQVFPNEN